MSAFRSSRTFSAPSTKKPGANDNKVGETIKIPLALKQSFPDGTFASEFKCPFHRNDTFTPYVDHRGV